MWKKIYAREWKLYIANRKLENDVLLIVYTLKVFTTEKNLVGRDGPFLHGP